MTSKEQILVTGGAGFIGANLVRLLLQHDYAVTVLDNFTSGRWHYLLDLPIQIVQGDILDTELLPRLLSNIDGVVHLAAQAGVPASLTDPKRDCEINVIGTLNLLEAMRQTKSLWEDSPGPLVFASSNAPLGRQEPPAKEDKVPLPVSPYGASKLAAEAYCLAYHASWGLKTVVLRFANVYGPFSGHKHSVVAKFLKDINNSGRITLDGDGRQTRDFIYVEDLCRAILLALRGEASGELFQIATGIETSILALAGLVRQITRQNVKIDHGPARTGDIYRNYSTISKAKEILGWQPEISLIEGLERTHAWFVEYGDLYTGPMLE